MTYADKTFLLIAHPLGKSHTFGEICTISSNHGMTWGEVAEVYSEVTGLKVRWCTEAEYVEKAVTPDAYRRWYYCRHIYDRTPDASKILAATGLTVSELTTPRGGLCRALDLLG